MYSDINLTNFVAIMESVTEVDTEWFYDEVNKTIRYYRNPQEKRPKLRELQKLERRWYRSIARKRPDYSVYKGVEIIPELWACWMVYSKDYIKKMLARRGLLDPARSVVDDIGMIDTIVDLGCGIGYTTTALRSIYSGATVYGANVKGSVQYDICDVVSRNNDWRLVSDFHEIQKIDYRVPRAGLVLASEYFEHFYEPIDHLLDIIETLRPKYWVIANAFTQKSLGHFDEYKYGDTLYEGKAMSRLFNKTMREHGFEKQQTTFWNSRPNYWKLKGVKRVI